LSQLGEDNNTCLAKYNRYEAAQLCAAFLFTPKSITQLAFSSYSQTDNLL